MTNKIRKAVIPVAGLGTRFLPATKAQPKEMLTLVDKPVIQYIVEEAVRAGIEQIIFITSQTKRAIEDHFDRNFELEYNLAKKNKLADLEEVKKISQLADFIYIRQEAPLGLGHAIASAAPIIDDEPFAVFLGDDIIDGSTPAIQELINIYQQYNKPVIAIKEVSPELVFKYGIIDGTPLNEKCYQINTLVEKPPVDKAPSNLAIIGRYILTPEIMEILKNTPANIDGEIQLTDALLEYIKAKEVYATKFSGQHFDCGNKLDFMKAAVYYASKHPEIKKDFKKFIHSI